ncbi:MAG: hypothetical protein COS84_06700 [Armatimonadetes bacterium CG07_land_8_20_14_0_80_40_9]|nr:MAG: hypothetical protein COS84_06700 [Armatimonadetes bacterium CG07_land_8_20_14_0_80_40_9]
MNILVCLKQTPDTETKIKVKEGEKKIDEEGVNFVVNPYDEYAIEEALKIKEKYSGEVTIICLGPKRAEQSIRTGLAMGVDKAIHLTDPAFEGGDSLAVAKSMAKAKAGLAVTRVTQKAVELLGPLGYSRKYLLEKWVRDAKINDIFEGTGQIQMLITARRILDFGRDKLK